MPVPEVEGLWSRITCATLLVNGTDSWASNPATDGRAAHFKNAKVVEIEDAGHWVHHDQLDTFVKLASEFIV